MIISSFISKGNYVFIKLLGIVIMILLLGNDIECNSINSTVKFEGQTNIGKIKFPGSYKYNPKDNTHKLTGSGANIWGTEDAFFFVWNKVKGDLSMSFDLNWIGEGKHAHRKGGWMIRAGLNSDDVYVDAAVHGDGLISLQYREKKGGDTYEIIAPVSAPVKLNLERTGEQYTLSFYGEANKIHPVGTITVSLPEEVYAGQAVCSHDSTTEETAIFSNVEFEKKDVPNETMRVLESTLETINIESGIRTIVRRAKEHFEAPNWTSDGKYFIYNSGGKLYSLSSGGGTPKLINTDFANNCNNDHGISPDGKLLVISHSPENKSLIYTLPFEGGEPKLITKNGPSYWHGWSPDTKTLAYCAERDGEYDIYTIPVEGGEETRLTNTPGLDDGPEYSPDGKYIYFNSVRTGQMKIWRMKSDGSEQTQITPLDDYGDWFAHPSPDGKWLVFVSYDKSVVGHPPNKNVVLRLMPVSGGEPKIIAKLFGGQGTINVPSWSQDSKNVAFVSYRLVAP